MRIKEMSKIIPLGIALIFLGCGDKEKPQQIAQKTNEVLGEVNSSGCNTEEAKESEGCSEESSSSFILEELTKDNTQQEREVDSLRGQLNTLLNDMSQKEKEKQNPAIDNLELLVTQVGDLLEKDSNKVAEGLEGLENLVETYDKQENAKSIREGLISLVDGIENSKLKREAVEAKLLSLVGEVENKKINRKEVEAKLLSLVGDATKGQKSSLKQTQESLESLVSSAEKEGTTTAKRLARSMIEDVSQNRIKILQAEDTFVVIQVQAGDSLSALASKYYGDAAKYKIIYEANQEKIGNKNTIYPGTTLVIPKL